MPRKNQKQTPKHNDSLANDMWSNLMSNPISPACSSSAQSSQQSPPTSTEMGFASYAPPIAYPFPLAQNDPRQTYQFGGWYGETPRPQFQDYTQTSRFHDSPQTSHQHHTSSPPHYQPTPTIPDDEIQHTNPQKRNQIRWSDEDARILAERWVNVSQNSVTGNSQPDRAFWSSILTEFNALASEKRNLNQLHGKWNKISPDVKVFNSIYNQHHNNRPSGTRDEDVLRAARDHFRERNGGRKFIYEQCWNALRGYPKFFYEDGVMKNKRSFQPEPVNLDSEDVPHTNPFENPLSANTANLFRDDPIRRPPGRDISRKSQRSSGSSDAGSSSRSLRDEAVRKIIETADAQQSAIDKLTDLAEKS